MQSRFFVWTCWRLNKVSFSLNCLIFWKTTKNIILAWNCEWIQYLRQTYGKCNSLKIGIFLLHPKDSRGKVISPQVVYISMPMMFMINVVSIVPTHSDSYKELQDVYNMCTLHCYSPSETCDGTRMANMIALHNKIFYSSMAVIRYKGG